MTINKKYIDYFVNVTSKAAFSSSYFVGKKDKSAADKAATDSMRLELKDGQGNYKQLNTNLLQIENEYYGSVRPKRLVPSGSSPSLGLKREGVDVSNVKIDDDKLTALVLLGIRNQDQFPLIFFRENCADMAICADDIDESFIKNSKSVLVTGTNFSS